jgi:hypothetical protein
MKPKRVKMSTTTRFDELDIEIEARNIAFENLVTVYRNFLLRLTRERRFKNISEDYLELISTYLHDSLISKAKADEETRLQTRNKLWELADKNKENEDCYNLARCVLFLFGSKGIGKLDRTLLSFISSLLYRGFAKTLKWSL